MTGPGHWACRTSRAGVVSLMVLCMMPATVPPAAMISAAASAKGMSVRDQETGFPASSVRQLNPPQTGRPVATAARTAGTYERVHDVWARSSVPVATLERLAKADGFRSLGLDRRAAQWEIRALGPEPLPLFAVRRTGGALFAAAEAEEQLASNEPAVDLPEMGLGENVLDDYASLRLSLKAHPLALLRGPLEQQGQVQSRALRSVPLDRSHTVSGLVLVRQRPGTASGVIFMTLEDETGVANIVVWPRTFERFRKVVLMSRLLQVTGKVQREEGVIHLIADHMVDVSDRLDELGGVGLPKRPSVYMSYPSAMNSPSDDFEPKGRVQASSTSSKLFTGE